MRIHEIGWNISVCLCGHKIIEAVHIQHKSGRKAIIGSVCARQVSIPSKCSDCNGERRYRSKRCEDCAKHRRDKLRKDAVPKEKIVIARCKYDQRLCMKAMGLEWDPTKKVWWTTTIYPKPIEKRCKKDAIR